MTKTKHMKTIAQVLEGCADLAEGTTLKINGLVSSDDTVSDVVVTLLPPDGYRDMQREDYVTVKKALLGAELQEGEVAAAMEMMLSLEKALAPSEGTAPARGPQYENIKGTPLYRLQSNPDAAVYLLRLRKEGPVVGGKPPKSALALAKFELTRKLQLQVGNYVHAVKLQDGRFGALEVV